MNINTIDNRLRGKFTLGSFKVEDGCVWFYDQNDCKGNMLLMIPLSNISSIDMREDK